MPTGLLLLTRTTRLKLAPLDLDSYRAIEAEAHAVMIAEDDAGKRVGAVVLLAPGRDYENPNYRWFEDQLESFLYVDRIIVSADARKQGVGLALYAEALELAEDHGAGCVTAEVNLDPPNPVSIAFHEKLGFTPIGEQSLPNGKRVVMLSRATLNPKEFSI